MYNVYNFSWKLCLTYCLQALGVHGHEEEEDAHGHEHGHGGQIHFEAWLGYSLAALGGIYAFYLFEKIMSIYRGHVSDVLYVLSSCVTFFLFHCFEKNSVLFYVHVISPVFY